MIILCLRLSLMNLHRVVLATLVRFQLSERDVGAGDATVGVDLGARIDFVVQARRLHALTVETATAAVEIAE